MIQEKYRRIPHSLGIFFAIAGIMTLSFALCLSAGCNTKNKKNNSQPQPKEEKEGDFVLLGNRGSILEASLTLMKASKDYGSNADGVFNRMKVGDVEVEIDIDLENAYACSYSDHRRVVCYPVKQIVLPQKGEKKPVCFLHYFDEKGMSMFFHVVTGLTEENPEDAEGEESSGFAPYEVWFLSPKEEPYGLVRSRILDKTELSEEEAFRKFDRSRRTVLMGTNTLDENKFLFIFFKIPSLSDRIFQIYTHWY